MNHKKIVIFHVNSQEQYYGEFHENTKVRMIKSFFRDVSHYNKFKLICNGNTCSNDELTLKELAKGSSNYEIFIKIALNTSVTANNYFSSETENLLVNENNMTTFFNNTGTLNAYSLPNLNLNSHNHEEVIKENFMLRNKIEELDVQSNLLKEENFNQSNTIADLNSKVQIAQRAYDTVSLQLYNATKTIEQMQSEFSDLQSSYNYVKTNLERYQKDYNNSGKRTSLVGSNVSFNFGFNSKRKSNFGDIPGQSVILERSEKEGNNSSALENNNVSTSNSPFTINIKPATGIRTSIYSNSSTRKSVLSNSVPTRKSVMFKENAAANKKKSVLMFNKSTTASPTKVISLSSDTKKGEIEITKGLNKAYSMEDLKKNITNTKIFKTIKSDSKSHWNKILVFLPTSDQLSFSLSCKDHFKKVTNFWYDQMSAKIENIDETLSLNKQQYDILLENQQFSLSPSTNTAFKILNNAKYLEIFSNDNSYFDNNKILPVYLLLFQLTKIFPYENDNNEFINKFKTYFNDNSKPKGLGELLKSLPKKCDFTDINVEKIKDIMKYFIWTTVDCGSLGKVCKTTGIIAFFVKDALVFCGLDVAPDKRAKEGNDQYRVSVIKDNIDIREMKIKCEKILGNFDGLSRKLKIN